jgi:elongation factor Ts
MSAAEINTARIKELRERTGAGMVDCRNALVEAGGDIEKAIDLLREKGRAGSAKRAGREARQGVIDAYIHPGGQVGVLLELSCETDFAARDENFKALAHDICLHIAASAPDYLRREDVPADVIEREREVYRAQALEEGKKPEFVDRIVEGRLDKFYKERVLLEQVFVKDENSKRTVGDLVREFAAVVGENVTVRRYARFRVGDV